MSIPKRIIHIYSAPEGKPASLPLLCEAARTNATLLHPEYELILFDRTGISTFIDQEFPQYKSVFSSFPLRIQQFDFFRYLAIYRLGGFYFDLDVFLARKLDPLLGHQCVFSFEELSISTFLREKNNLDWEMANYGFGAAPGDPFLAAIIQNCVRGLEDPVWANKMMEGIPRWFRGQFIAPTTTGPGMVTRTFAEHADLQRNVTVLFPEKVCDETTWQRFGDFGVHLMQASWRKRDGFFRSRLARWWEARKRRRLLAESRRLGETRSGNWRQHRVHRD